MAKLPLKEIISVEIHHHSLGGQVKWELMLQDSGGTLK